MRAPVVRDTGVRGDPRPGQDRHQRSAVPFSHGTSLVLHLAEAAGAHDLVTVAGQRAEQQLSEALRRLLPGSAVVGEETVHAHPASYAAPAFGRAVPPAVAGDEGFCTMVALAHGATLAGWILAPALDRTATARRGGGAFLNGGPLRAGSPAAGATLHVAVSHPDHTDAAQERALRGLRTDGMDVRPTGSAGLELAGGNALPFTAARDADTTRRMVGLLRNGSDDSDDSHRSRPA
ncbi:inositol monophosphatase [Streptomyces smyrnaeus]|uniref:Inositol monophosphatase n=1 Tax=Streptomyces smyrnaeus TaxID=1387713 RepID=A0ABS3XY98_9ACTN|nr:inositol monophosphatase [Streptomyces smyrnaeus]